VDRTQGRKTQIIMAVNQRILSVMQEKIGEGQEDAFIVVDLKDVHEKFNAWHRHLPRVEPFYAVKCNDDVAILREMVKLGMNYDCASKGEIQKMLSLGARPSSIIYANPCKQLSHLRYAKDVGVEMITFDNADELCKIKMVHPHCKLLLRLLPDDSKSVCRLGNKYGARLSMVEYLLKLSQQLELKVCGVSYHVGSGCYDESAFIDAIYLARKAFDIAEAQGVKLEILDIGGGFPGDSVSEWNEDPVPTDTTTGSKALMFPEIARQITLTLDQLFPRESGVRIIAEPGRYFVHSCATLAVSVIGKRTAANNPCETSTLASTSEEDTEGSSCDHMNSIQSMDGSVDTADSITDQFNDSSAVMYYINEGVYGTFNNVIYDHAIVSPLCNVLPVMRDVNDTRNNSDSILCSLWGPSCDGLDCIVPEMYLPNLKVGSWLYFTNMGAYTSCAAASFNGFELPTKICLSVNEEDIFE